LCFEGTEQLQILKNDRDIYGNGDACTFKDTDDGTWTRGCTVSGIFKNKMKNK